MEKEDVIGIWLCLKPVGNRSWLALTHSSVLMTHDIVSDTKISPLIYKIGKENSNVQ